MAYAGKIEDLSPEDRYSSDRLRSLIEQAVKPIWLREILGGFLYKIKQLETVKYDLAVWEVDADDWLKIPGKDLEPKKIWGERHDYIPRKDEELQIGHHLYKVVKVMYDLEDDHIRILVVRLT